jgi:hypothetical protein
MLNEQLNFMLGPESIRGLLTDCGLTIGQCARASHVAVDRRLVADWRRKLDCGAVCCQALR